MTCEECELLLAQDEVGSEVEAHLAGCPGCRSLAAELQANAHAMRALGAEVMPALTMPKRAGSPWWKWSSAAAALVVTLTTAWWASRPPKPPQIVSVDVKVTGIVPREVAPVPAKIPEKLTPAVVPTAAVAYKEPLRVKMLTPDPDVVIYWLVDQKGELE
jgi:hypothetical protein